MPRETNIWEIIKAAGYEPIENRSIVVSYASSPIFRYSKDRGRTGRT